MNCIRLVPISAQIVADVGGHVFLTLVVALYLDNDVSVRIVPLVREAGHQVVHTRDIYQNDFTDDAQLLFAFQRGWVLVTHNWHDFRLLHNAWWRWQGAWRDALVAGVPVALLRELLRSRLQTRVRVLQHPGIIVLDHVPPENVARQLIDFLAEQRPLINWLWRERRGVWELILDR
ncbi:MAG: DUF5615 family PIN-like protein [Chloroflexi bacterium]|nr:DUF5615 family PIN-like protein [Chloroflexota bacterium]